MANANPSRRFASEPAGNPTRHNAAFQRLYKDGDWKTTHSLGRDDLLLLAKVADLAHSRIRTSLKPQFVVLY